MDKNLKKIYKISITFGPSITFETKKKFNIKMTFTIFILPIDGALLKDNLVLKHFPKLNAILSDL